MICQLGLPTLFVTFTSVESKWTTLMLALHTLNKNHTKIPIFFNNELEYKHFIDLVRSNPITCAHYYNHQMATFCNLLKKCTRYYDHRMVALHNLLNTCTCYYDHRMDALHNLLNKNSSIFGKVDDFYFVTKL
jgi:hypothetical protein